MADTQLLPLFLNLAGRAVVLVGGGRVAAGKLRSLVEAEAHVRVVAPAVIDEVDAIGREAEAHVEIVRRAFVPEDLDGMWLAVAAATPEVNRQVSQAAEARRVFVNAVDDPANASAFLTGTIRRSGLTLAISTNGDAPALTSLIREALEALLPADVERWTEHARTVRKGWRRGKVAMAQRKPLLLETLNQLYGIESKGQRAEGRGQSAEGRGQRVGHVALVGAGPGDPGLLTRKAVASLRAADLVLYDALIDDRMLRYARKAQRFFVGKRAGRHALTQDAIQRVMIRAARRGRRVVRLKGGDPFVFGRGGEEAVALRDAGVSYEIVPGVTSVVAAPELAGIPLTYRGRASAFVVVSGHDRDTFRSTVRALQPAGVTLVVLMGVGQAATISDALAAADWPPNTPAAIVVNASMPNQRVWRGVLAELAAGAEGLNDNGPGGPGTIVIGDVVDIECQRSVPDTREGDGPSVSAPEMATRRR